MKQFFGFPNTYVLIFLILLVTALATWVLPAGEYDRAKDKDGRTIVVAGSFHPVPRNPQHVQVLMAPVEGIKQTVGIISFIFFIGGAFAVLAKTGTIDVGIHQVVKKLKHRGGVLIPIVMLVFSLGGAIIGMSEETIPFVLVFIPLALALGYDSIVGVSMCFVGAGLGFAGAMLNPFTVGIAQGICELPLFSGIGYRTVCYLVIVTVGVSYVMWYARRVKRNPELSPVFAIDQERRKAAAGKPDDLPTEFNRSHLLVLMTFLAALGLLVFGVVTYHWYIPEMAAIFLGTGILVGIFGGLAANEIAETYILGVKDIAGAAIVVGLSRSILVVAQDGHILDTILYYLSSLIGSGSPLIAAQMQFLVQTLLNLLVPSGSGHAALTMPLMGPLSDLVGVTRQTSVLAFQFGEGFTTLVVPTSGVTMSVLSLAKIPWKDWFKFMWPLQVILGLVGAALLVWPVMTKWP